MMAQSLHTVRADARSDGGHEIDADEHAALRAYLEDPQWLSATSQEAKRKLATALGLSGRQTATASSDRAARNGTGKELVQIGKWTFYDIDGKPTVSRVFTYDEAVAGSDPDRFDAAACTSLGRSWIHSAVPPDGPRPP